MNICPKMSAGVRLHSAQRWCTLISSAIISAIPEHRALQECWGSAQRWFTSISTPITSVMLGQRVLQECWRSSQRWRTSVSRSIFPSALWLQAWFELRGVVKPLTLFYSEASGRVALLASCHLFSRHLTRKSDILYTCSALAFGLALWL